MFRALVELGRGLEQRGDLPPPGYYKPKEPIKWLGRVTEDGVLVTPSSIGEPRPYYGGRTSGVTPLLLADKAVYALGIDKSGLATYPPPKHEAFIALLEELAAWKGLSTDLDLQDILRLLIEHLKNRRIKGDFGKVKPGDVVTFSAGDPPHHMDPLLIRHPSVRTFWHVKLERMASTKGGKLPPLTGICSICGEEKPLMRLLPLQVKLLGTVAPLHSFNKASFPSYYASASPHEKTHTGLCFDCSETASRAFNFLSQSEEHHKTLIFDTDKPDALTNHIALFWTKAPAAIEAGELTLDNNDLNSLLAGVLTPEHRDENPGPTPTLPQIEGLLGLPWKPVESHLKLDDYGFYLAVLSPNVGRIALREWMAVSLTALKANLQAFLTATRIIAPWGDPPEPRPIAELVRSLDGANPNHVRGLLRTAYLGHPPPAGLKQAAVARLRNARVLEDPKEAWRLRALASLLKLVLFYGKKEAEKMETLDPGRKTPAYLSGRLLAVLEEAQKRAQGYNINRTLVEQFYGSASTAPAATFGLLLRTASVAHLQKAGSLNPLVEEILSALDDAGGFPKTLTLEEQAEFALGFYHQRADFRARSKAKQAEKAEVNHE